MSSTEVSGPLVVKANPDRKKVVVRSNRIPDKILNDPEIARDSAILPANYSFEIPKTIWRLKSSEAQKVALQFPEGLALYATTIADILEKHAAVECVIMADVTYGACCVDDYSARALGVNLLTFEMANNFIISISYVIAINSVIVWDGLVNQK